MEKNGKLLQTILIVIILCGLSFGGGVLTGCTQNITRVEYIIVSQSASASIKSVEARIEVRENTTTNFATIIIGEDAATNWACIRIDSDGKKTWYDAIPTNMTKDLSRVKEMLKDIKLPAKPILP